MKGTARIRVKPIRQKDSEEWLWEYSFFFTADPYERRDVHWSPVPFPTKEMALTVARVHAAQVWKDREYMRENATEEEYEIP